MTKSTTAGAVPGRSHILGHAGLSHAPLPKNFSESDGAIQ